MFLKGRNNIMDKILVSIFGFLGVIFTFWFFLMKNEKQQAADKEVDITVNGGYSPAVIVIPQGKAMKLNFVRTDPSTCLEEVVLTDFKIRKYLPLNQKVTLTITPQKTGEYNFSCGMNMYHGKVIVQ